MLSFAKTKTLLLPMCALMLFGVSCKKGEQAGGEAGDLKTEMEKVSYILGFKNGAGLKSQSVDIDTGAFIRGLNEGLKDPTKSAFKPEEEQKILQAFRTSLMEKHKKVTDEKAAKNAAAGEKFLAENKTKPGVVALPSGVQYIVEKAGAGEKPTEEDTVMVKYKGTLLDGTVFDQNESAALNLKYVVPGFAEAVKLMPVGSKWNVFIPGNLAYGPREAGGGKIGPSETLKFELELLSIKKPEKEAKVDTQPAPKTAPKAAPKTAPKTK